MGQDIFQLNRASSRARMRGALSGRRGIVVWAAGALVIGAAIVFFLLKPADLAQRATAGPAVGRPVADFSLPALSGRQTALHEFLGRPMLLQFWAVDCPSCAAERPALLRAAAPFTAKAGVAIGVDAYMESSDMVRDYLTDHREPYTTILIDADGEVVYRKFHIGGVPTSLFIDRHGIVRQIAVGEMTEQDLRAAFAKISA
jgi:cytochrome c biogenesis protein CcmG/thiol:disulfide interchange protein DsbE